MAKESRRISDPVTGVSSNETVVRWKDNEIVDILSKFTGNEPV